MITEINKDEPFFSFKFLPEKTPLIFLYLPYENKIVRQKFEFFHKKWIPVNTEIFYDISIVNSILDVFSTCDIAENIFKKHCDKKDMEFKPDMNYVLYIKKNNKISGCAYRLNGFKEPEKLGCFFDHESKIELDKYLIPLFL